MFRELFKKCLHLSLPAIIISLIIGADVTFAAEDTFQDFLQTWGRIIALIGSLINVILWIVIKYIGDLLTNDFIFGAGIEDMLKSIWQTVRNFVNLAFVFVLLVIAFYNIVSIDPEKIPLKKSLGKVAIALILVNFSYFAAKVVLDVANILTTAVFAIPRDIITDLQLSTAENTYGADAISAKCAKKYYQGDTTVSMEHLQSDPDAVRTEEGGLYHKDAGGDYLLIPTKCFIPNLVKIKLFKEGTLVDGDAVTAQYDQMKVYLYYRRSADDTDPINMDEELEKVETGQQTVAEYNEKLGPAELTAKKFGRNTITMVLAKTMFDLNQLTAVSSASSTGFFGFTIGGMVNLLLLLLYGTMFVAMFIVLIFRVVYLWMCIAFSPLVALMFVFKDFGVEMPDGANIPKLFIQYAFVPVKMGIALSVGVLMLFKANQQSILGETATTFGEKAADIQIPIDTLVSDSSVQKLMWNIATVAVIWIAIKWSLSDLSGPVKGIVDKITGYVGAVGEVAAKIPLTLPIAPYANLSEGGERKMTTAGAVLRLARATNLDRIVEGMITGEDKKTGMLRQHIGDQLEAIGEGDRNVLKSYTKNDEWMTNVVNDNNPTNRNKLADKLVLTGMVSKDDAAYKKWAESNKTPADFRTLLQGAMNETQRNTMFGEGVDVEEAWHEKGKPAVSALKAADSALFNGEAMNTNEWKDLPAEFDDIKNKIKSQLATLPPPAGKALESNLQVEKDGEKYSAKKTQEVLEQAVKALEQIKNKEDADRKTVEDGLSGRALELFNVAKGSIPKEAPASAGP